MRAHSPRRNFGQRLGSALPHAAHNFLFVVLSVPALSAGIALTRKTERLALLVSPGAEKGQRACTSGSSEGAIRFVQREIMLHG